MSYFPEAKSFNEKTTTHHHNSELQDEVFNFLESIKPAPGHKEKARQLYKNKQLDIIPEVREKKKIVADSVGLTDNILNDYEYKDKARKGLLHLLNKLSGGSFCPEIKEYFKDLEETRKHDMTMISSKKDLKNKSLENNNKSLRRQNFIEKTTTSNKDRIENETIKDEDIFKINFRNTGNSKEKGTLTVLNSINTKQLTFKKRDKKKKKGNRDNANEGMKFTKNYLLDLSENDLNLYYSDKEFEKSDKEFNGPVFNFKSKPNSKKVKNNAKKKNKKNFTKTETNSAFSPNKAHKLFNATKKESGLAPEIFTSTNPKKMFKPSHSRKSSQNAASNKHYKNTKPKKKDFEESVSSESQL